MAQLGAGARGRRDAHLADNQRRRRGSLPGCAAGPDVTIQASGGITAETASRLRVPVRRSFQSAP